MKNAKDTFYVALRDRLAAVNPARTFVLRGVVRPGIMVVENEMVSAELPADVFPPPVVPCHQHGDHSPPGEVVQHAEDVLGDRVPEVVSPAPCMT